jgi:hypothetical protein
MSEKEHFEVMMNDDNDETETHRVVYLAADDMADWIATLEIALNTPKAKFSKRYGEWVKTLTTLKGYKKLDDARKK